MNKDVFFTNSTKSIINQRNKFNRTEQNILNKNINYYFCKMNKKKRIFDSFKYLIFLTFLRPILSYSINIKVKQSSEEVPILYYKNIGKPTRNSLNEDMTFDSASKYMKYRCTSDICDITLFWDNVTELPTEGREIFNECKTIISVDFTDFNTTEITSMAKMFADCSSLTSIVNLTSTKVETFSLMFYNCVELNNIQNFQILNQENSIIHMNYMFFNCKELKSIYLTMENTIIVDIMGSAFSNCTKLTNITFNKKINIYYTYNMSYMFDGCSDLISLNFNDLFFKEKIDKNVTNKTTVNMASMFANCISLKELNIDILKKSKVNNIGSMFYNCENLTSINISGFNTSNVKNMSKIFYNCVSLNSLNIEEIDTASVTTMNYSFYNCVSLESLNLISLNTKNVEYMEYMFYGCKNLSNLTLNSETFKANNAIYMNHMFKDCSSLKNVSLAKFSDNKLRNIVFMFEGCYSLQNVSLSNINVNNIQNSSYMFHNCYSLSSLKI